MLVVEDLKVRVAGRRVVEGVAIKLPPGEVHVLVGPNGAGKSTLLKAIAGVRGVEVESGRVVVDGADVTREPAWARVARGVMLVWQLPPRLPGLKVADIASELGRKFRSDWLSLARELGVEELLDRQAFVDMSGGEARRVELYLSLIPKPKYLLVDEVDSGVDATNLRRIASVLSRAAESGAGLLIVTHTGAILERLGRLDHYYVMVSGRIVAEGDSMEELRDLLGRGYEGIAG